MHVVDCGERIFFGDAKDDKLHDAISVTVCRNAVDSWSTQRTRHIPPIDLTKLNYYEVQKIDDGLFDVFHKAFIPELEELLIIWPLENPDSIMRDFQAKKPIAYNSAINDCLCRVAQDGIDINGYESHLDDIKIFYLRFKIFIS